MLELTHALTAPEFFACRAAIQKLKEDNAKLKEELLLENKFSVTPTTANAAALIGNLQEQSDVYTRKVKQRCSCQASVRPWQCG